jgi:hypothetical protein
LIETLPFLLL